MWWNFSENVKNCVKIPGNVVMGKFVCGNVYKISEIARVEFREHFGLILKRVQENLNGNLV